MSEIQARTEDRRLTLIGWIAVVVPVFTWMAHLMLSAAYVAGTGRVRIGSSDSCRPGGPVWPFHLGTGLGALICLATLALALVVYRQRNGSGEGDLSSQYRFLGLLGIGSSVFNFVLILAEGSLVPFLHSCG